MGAVYVIFIFVVSIAYLTAQPTVQIGQGVLVGTYITTVNGRQISAYLGIPYAKPPIGKHRFKESIPATPWTGFYNATSYSSDCFQYSHLTYHTEHEIFGSEDCLYVNVYTPKKTPDVGSPNLLDVLVFIHGGAFMFFSSAPYRPDFLLDRDIVLVTFNYRLGPLGFLSMEDNILPGNNGMKDQVLALKWVKNNIAAFGGNPNSITLSGLSAGGASVHYHILSPLSQGLFNKAMVLGGSALTPWAQMENARGKTMIVAESLGCPTNDTTFILKCLRERPAKQIVAATKLLQTWLYNPFSPFGVVVEPPGPSAFISEQPIDIILQKKAKDMPILFTMNSDEGLYPGQEIISDPQYIEAIENNWNKYLPFLLDYNYTAPAGQMDIISQKIREYYMGNSTVNNDKPKFIKMISDRMFCLPIIKTAQLHGQHYNSPVYSYIFSHRAAKSESDLFYIPSDFYDGTPHGEDVIFVIKATYKSLEKDQNDLLLSKRMIDYWLTFIKGAPMPKGWPNVRDNLPNFGFLEIQNSDQKDDIVRIEADYANEKFWKTLNLNENIPRSINRNEEL